MADINDLRRERMALVEDGRSLLEAVEAESRALTDEEKTNDDTRADRIAELGETIDRLERQEKFESEISHVPEPASRPVVEDRKVETPEDNAQEAFSRYLRLGETRALSADLDVEGGYTVPDTFRNELIKKVDDLVFIRQRATVISAVQGSLGIPTLANDPADSDWTAELATGGTDSTMDFGKRELNPKPLAKKIKVSNKLLRASAIGVEALVRDRLAYKFAITEEKAFLTGNGSGQPLGVFTASAAGISTSQDVSTGNTISSVTFDGLINALYTLKPAYWAGAVLLGHRDLFKQVRKLKDGDGQYIWQPGGQAGQPDRVLGVPFIMSEYAPNTFATGNYVGIIANFEHYYIADALALTLQRLVELYAETNQIGFIGRLETDGMPVLEEAFVRIKLA